MSASMHMFCESWDKSITFCGNTESEGNGFAAYTYTHTRPYKTGGHAFYDDTSKDKRKNKNEAKNKT